MAGRKRLSPARELSRRLNDRSPPRGKLHRIAPDALTLRRRRTGKGFSYTGAGGRPIRDPREIARLKRLAVPPAYEDVRYAADPAAHIQAVGKDKAGRTQYRYHPDWDKLRERRKALHLEELLRRLPAIRRRLNRHLREKGVSREFVLAAMIDLIARTALRPGSEAYAREHGTRGAATLLKSDVTLKGDGIALAFRGKGGKRIARALRSKPLARALRRLKALPGKRLFQYRGADGELHLLRRRDANAFLHSMASDKISLKDFRTLTACSRALENLVALDPRQSEAGRKRQLKACLCAVSEELANTPAICRKSYVHAVVVQAFEDGSLKAISARTPSRPNGEALLRAVLRKANAGAS